MRSRIEVSKTFFDQKAVQTILFSMVHSLQNHKPKNNIHNIGYLKTDLKILQNTKIFNYLLCTVKLGIKELLNKEQIGFKELFTDYQLFYTINQGLLNLDGRNCQKYLHQTKADFLTLIMLHKLTQSL
jgi:hypothetical protein